MKPYGEPLEPHIGGSVGESLHRGDCLQMRRPAEQYGDVVLSVQASWGHYCEHEAALREGKYEFYAQMGCAHEPLERYATVEIALYWADKFERWITCPSKDLGIDGFDDLWSGDDVSGYVPLSRVGQLQMALARREA